MVKCEDFFLSRSKSKVNDSFIKNQIKYANSLLDTDIIEVTKLIHHRNDYKSIEISVSGESGEFSPIMNSLTCVIPGLYTSRVDKLTLKFNNELSKKDLYNAEFRFMKTVGKHKIVIDIESNINYYNDSRKFQGINPLFTKRGFDDILAHMDSYFDGLVERLDVRRLKTPEDEFLVIPLRFLDGTLAKISFDSTFIAGIEVREVNSSVFNFVATIAEMLYSLGCLGISLTTLKPLYSECKIPILQFIDDTFGMIYPEFFMFE